MFAATDVFVREKLRHVHAGGFAAATEVQMALVQNLDLHGTRLTRIAARASMTKQSMLELIDKAERSGFVERRTDHQDRRAKLVAFTPLGLDMLGFVREGVAEAERRMEAVVGAAFLSTMKRQLATYVAASGVAGMDRAMSNENHAWRLHAVNRLLASASSAFVRDVLGVVHEGGFDTVAAAHQTLFRNLDLGGTRLTALAARARMTKQAMAELVDGAERLGFVVRQPDPGDQRAKIVAFTASGVRMLEQQRKGVVAAERRMAAVAGAAFVADLRAHLAEYVSSASAGVLD